MGCRIVVGGQYGSEGKGKVVALYAAMLQRPWVVRCGGPNSGHTISIRDREVVLRQVPAGAAQRDSLLLLSAGCVVDEGILIDELDMLDIPRERIVVDPRCALILPADQIAEKTLVQEIGSTGSGTGTALMRRLARSGSVALAKTSSILHKRVRVEPVAPLVHKYLDDGGDVIVEGTQGFGLSLLHGPHYPHVTSRDTTAAGFASEVGLSPRQVNEITLVIRTFPIRVGGPSGPLEDQITWDEVQQISGAPEIIPELTSVTKRVRRVGMFNMRLVIEACRYNRPTAIALMGLDRLDYSNLGATSIRDISPQSIEFIRELERQTGIHIEWLGTGFGGHDAFHCEKADRRAFQLALPVL